MKKKFKILTGSGILLAIFICMNSCFTPEPSLPDILIINPTYDQEIGIGEIVNIQAEVSDDDGTISEVVISADSVELSRLTKEPFSAQWDTESWSVGKHRVIVNATDNDGNTFTVSNPVNLIQL